MAVGRAISAALTAAVVLAVGWVVPVPADAAATTISASISPSVIELGQTTHVSGTVNPAGATSTVVVQRGVGGRWTDRQGGPVSGGKFRIGIKPSQGGVYALRVRSSGGTVISNTVYVKVKFPAAQAIRAVDFARFTYTSDEGDVCGNGDGELLPLGRGKVAYGDLTGDGIEEAAVVYDCIVRHTGERYTPLLVVALVHGKPDPIDLTLGEELGFYSWTTRLTSSTISSRRIHARGIAYPPSSCHLAACRPTVVRGDYELFDGRLRSLLAG